MAAKDGHRFIVIITVKCSVVSATTLRCINTTQNYTKIGTCRNLFYLYRALVNGDIINNRRSFKTLYHYSMVATVIAALTDAERWVSSPLSYSLASSTGSPVHAVPIVADIGGH